jgi:hypothetical protein
MQKYNNARQSAQRYKTQTAKARLEYTTGKILTRQKSYQNYPQIIKATFLNVYS